MPYDILNHFRRLARYNTLANERLYAVCASLSDAERTADRKGLFKSIHGTLNHILVGDRLWMARFEGVDVPKLTNCGPHGFARTLGSSGSCARLRPARSTETSPMSISAGKPSPIRWRSRCRICSIIRPITAVRPIICSVRPAPRRRFWICIVS
jgi:hypothetical protein